MFKTYFLFKPGDDPFRTTGGRAAQLVSDMFPGIRGYVQTRALPGQDTPAFSGCAELFFDNAESGIAASRKGPGDLATDRSEVHSTLTGMERVVMRLPAYISNDRIKGVYPFCRKEGMEVEPFQHYWWHNHGPIAALTEEALGYVQVHPVLGQYDLSTAHYDGVTEIAWPDAASAGRALVSRQMTEDQANDAPNFVKMDSVALILAEEETIIAP